MSGKEIIAYMYEHDGMIHDMYTGEFSAIIVPKNKRWTKCEEPWTETALVRSDDKPAARVANRDELGRLVRDVWISWAKEQAIAKLKSNWLIPYDELDEPNKEVDRRIGETLYQLGASQLQAAPAKPAVAVPDSIISDIDFAIDAIYNETVMQVCCGRPGQECCGSPDADWPSWATEAMTKLSGAKDSLLESASSHSQQSARVAPDGYALQIDGQLNRNWVTFDGRNQSERMASAEGMRDSYISMCRPIDLPRLKIIPIYIDRCPSHESEENKNG